MLEPLRTATGPNTLGNTPFRRAPENLVSGDFSGKRPESGAKEARTFGASAARKKASASPDDALVGELAVLQERLAALCQACADAITVCVQHYQGEPAWVIGAMPSSDQIADEVEAQARSLIAHSLNGAQIDEVAQVMRSSGDLRATARAARQASQLIWLFRQDASGDHAIASVRAVGEATVAVAQLTARALNYQDASNARAAALLYREVDAARAAAELALTGQSALVTFSPTMRRMTRAAIWYMAVAGEGMARAAVRSIKGDVLP